MANLSFDTSAQEKPPYTPIPTGEYICKIVSFDDHTGATSGKKSLKLSLAISEGDFEGKTMNKFISVYNEDQTVQKKAIALVKHIVHCIGLQSLSDTNDAIGYDIVAVVKCGPKKDSEEIESSVVAFKKAGDQPVKSAPAAQDPFRKKTAQAAPVAKAVKQAAVDDDIPF